MSLKIVATPRRAYTFQKLSALDLDPFLGRKLNIFKTRLPHCTKKLNIFMYSSLTHKIPEDSTCKFLFKTSSR